MSLLLTGVLPDSINAVLQFLTVIVIFVVVLGITMFATRWIARYQKGATVGANIEVLETYRLANNKYVQIIRIGKKYMAVALGREEVTFLAMLSDDDIKVGEDVERPSLDFKSILTRLKNQPPSAAGETTATDENNVTEYGNTPPKT
ncbi:MAG: flagellar biosynthetic protein FliO [Lachnospiraceae bacterium]|jgi:flagellar protein FliO/FliZ|nr:flagellar biosynthetic protein FliO [Lachnospiraceae bacterium]